MKHLIWLLVLCGCATNTLISNYGEIPKQKRKHASFGVLHVPIKDASFEQSEIYKTISANVFFALNEEFGQTAWFDYSENKDAVDARYQSWLRGAGADTFIVAVQDGSTSFIDVQRPGYIFGNQYGISGSTGYTTKEACHNIKLVFYEAQVSIRTPADSSSKIAHTQAITYCGDNADLRGSSKRLIEKALFYFGIPGQFKTGI